MPRPAAILRHTGGTRVQNLQPTCCRLAELRVSGFKSLRDTRLELPTRLTILVGPNGSGKTAIIESLLLLRDTLDYLRGRIANPFLRWWGYRHAVWMHDETKPITISITLDCSACSKEELAKLLEEELGAEGVKSAVRGGMGAVKYRLVVSGTGGQFQIVEDEVCVDGAGCLAFSPKGVVLKIAKPLAYRPPVYHGNIAMDILPIAAKIAERADNIVIIGDVLTTCNIQMNDMLEQLRDQVIALLEEKTLAGGTPTAGVIPARSVLDLYLDRVGKANYPIDIFEEADAIVSHLSWESIAAVMLNKLDFTKLAEQLVSCLMSKLVGKQEKVDKLPGIVGDVARKLALSLGSSIATSIVAVLIMAAYLVGIFIDGITVLRLLDYRSLRSPQVLEPAGRLREDASNLLSVLFRLGRGRLPEDVAAVLADVLNASSVSGFFEPTPDGRVAFRLVVDNVEVAQPSVPEGAWKTMAVMAAVLSGASLVAVDEFENSLHASAQELLLEELRRSVPTAIVATHSPVVVDAAKSLDEVALVEIGAGGTRVRRIRDPEKLTEKLRELGVTPSEALLYGLLETS
ncbi:hypothetical protein Pdsh_06475 [Pyrodictium delaneyi]|uniref:AAA+ ATPase domain-containing protein n=1 Tax=Pyrodictium delaneyi TaxID=1273541 RepID=A0A211YNC5_9CREN|nr:hypothetical protein Pdsh_06690 [Pyrodictium delaneyi]OWJ54659.1 hypothetical protein Pdsh_06475 [Pyrodictium delaneyi]